MGIMSGTSADSIDAVVVRLSGDPSCAIEVYNFSVHLISS